MKLISTKNVFLIIGDAAISIFSIYVAYIIRFHYEYPFYHLYQTSHILMQAMAFAFFMVSMCFLLDLYSFEKVDGKKETFLKICFSGLFAAVTLASFYYFIPQLEIGRGLLFMAIGISITLQTFWHIAYRLILKLPMASKNVLILGTGQIAETMGELLNSSSNSFTLKGYVSCIGDPVQVPQKNVLGNGEGLLGISQAQRVEKVVVSLTERRGTFPVREVLDCKLNGIDIVEGASFFERLTGKLLIENMHPSHLIFSDGFRITIGRRIVKRLFDVFLAVVGIIMASPLLLVLPLVVKADSRGPVFFKQNRMGEGEKIFTIYKFRTMVQDAEKATGPVWSKSGDSRITKTGRILRKTRLDEIPQLFNVLRGDMSIIGPRPERPFFVESLKRQIPYYSERHCMKPGVTGWAQVKYQYGDSIDDAVEKLRYDLYYMKYQSMALDLRITIDTINVVLCGRGGR